MPLETFGNSSDELIQSERSFTSVADSFHSGEVNVSSKALFASAGDLNASQTFSRRMSISDRIPEFTFLEKTDNRKEKALAELTINKLNTTSMGLIGREDEISVLKSCYQRISATDKSAKELAWIHGLSGVGKSSLARSLQEEMTTNSDTIFAGGKFELTSADEPFSGVAQAFAELCRKIWDTLPRDSLSQLTKAITETMLEEAQMLTALIPELTGLYYDDGVEDISFQTRDTISVEQRKGRWKYAFRMLTRILGSHFRHITLMLDDLHWADMASLDVIEYLMSDIQNPYPLMIIGCYRSNEVGEDSALFSRIQTLKEKSAKFDFNITEIEVRTCDIDSVNKMIMSMMSIDDEAETRDLAEICFERTLGNPFFLIEFMKMLQADGLLQYSLGLMKWTWDFSSIKGATMSTGNVVDLLQTRMKGLPQDLQLLLQYAACLGCAFSQITLNLLWKQAKEANDEDKVESDVGEMLVALQKDKLIEPISPGQFRWVHDKVQEAALSLSGLVTPAFQFQLGKHLLQGLGGKDLEEQIFDVVDLINKDGNTRNQPDLAGLNLRAAKKARKMSAFFSSAKYAAYGIILLPRDSWTEFRELALELHSIAAEMELATGRVDMVSEYTNVVLDKDIYTPMEKMPLYMIKMKLLVASQLRFHDAVDLGLAVLKDLGISLIWNRNLALVQALIRAKKMIKKVKSLPDKYFDTLGRMKDPEHRAAVNLILKVWMASYSCQNLALSILCICKMMDLILQHGISENAGGVLASLTTLVLYLENDGRAVLKFGRMAQEIHEIYGKSRLAESTFTLYGHSMSWFLPFHACLVPTMNGYREGVRVGDNEYAYHCGLFHFVHLPYMLGRPLDSILEECPKIALQLEEANLRLHLLTLRVLWQMMINLQLRPSEKSMKLDGDILLENEYKEKLGGHVIKIDLSQNDLLVFMGDYETLAERAIEKGDTYAKRAPCNFMIPLETFHRGIGLYAMARRAKNRKYKKEAKRILKLISKWSKAGNPNVTHYDLMLRAEQAALDGKHGEADDLYKEAIVSAARPGHLQHAALFNERYADYRLTERGDVDDAKYHLGEAVRYYSDWGAAGKAEQLKEELAKLR